MTPKGPFTPLHRMKGAFSMVVVMMNHPEYGLRTRWTCFLGYMDRFQS
jgi:hypothetical protein